MEHLYNPNQMSEQEIKDTFVARTALVERLVDTVRNQREGAGVQHIVLVAPRGMGKTTILLMVQFAIQNLGPESPWLPIRFPEEMYGVNDLADFWLETLSFLAGATQDISLRTTIVTLKQRYTDSEILGAAAVAVLRGWCLKNGTRLLLLVDNFNQLLSQINDEQQNAALRNVLMNEGFLMILGAAPSFFKEASNYDQPLYNYFKIEHLNRISFENTLDLMKRRAEFDGCADFRKVLDTNAAGLRALDYFTGGNVRLVLFLYHILVTSSTFEAMQGLDGLLDQVTPFFKARTEALPPQQRKILDCIALTGNRTNEGIAPSEIAKEVRMTPQAVSAQLKRLADQGFVESVNLRGRSSYYVLSELLYSVWYQMRYAQGSRQRVEWLISFLIAWSGEPGLDEESARLKHTLNELHNGQGIARQSGDVPRKRLTVGDNARHQHHADLPHDVRLREYSAVYASGRDISRLALSDDVPDIFFPLSRALAYISTKDEALIEKLTPEMRPIVKAVVEGLRLS